MRIGIDASRVSVEKKTGTEIYAHCVIEELLKLKNTYEWILYTHTPISPEIVAVNPRARQSIWPQRRFWTVRGLSRAVCYDPCDILLTLATPVPLFCPVPSVGVIHGLEFEIVPESYSLFGFWHLVISTWYTARKSSAIITPSESTKKDLVELYAIPEKKITAIHSGIPKTHVKHGEISPYIQTLLQKPYIIWIGRKDYRKNVDTLVQAFTELQKDHRFDEYQLLLVGGQGYDGGSIKKAIQQSFCKANIHNISYVSEKEKHVLLEKARVFVFPSLAEGFGFPILEAQSYGVPVVCSQTSSLPEVAGAGARFVDPLEVTDIVEALKEILTDDEVAQLYTVKGLDNVKRFSFKKTAREMIGVVEQVYKERIKK